MTTFKDSQGRDWTITLNLGVAIAIKASLKVDLLQPESSADGGPSVLQRLGTDEMFLGEVLCALMADQFEKHDMDEAKVQAAFDGETLLAAQTALYEELADFFQTRGRADRATAVRRQKEIIEKAVAAVAKKVEAINVDSLIEKTVAEIAVDLMTSGATSGALPGDSESTPAPSPSGSSSGCPKDGSASSGPA